MGIGFGKEPAMIAMPLGREHLDLGDQRIGGNDASIGYFIVCDGGFSNINRRDRVGRSAAPRSNSPPQYKVRPQLVKTRVLRAVERPVHDDDHGRPRALGFGDRHRQPPRLAGRNGIVDVEVPNTMWRAVMKAMPGQ